MDITDFYSACDHVRNLSYERISDRNTFILVLSEQRGTCSSKHALLKALALENNFHSVSLCIGIYKMNSQNTAGIGSILENYNLSFIPEAHTYLRINNEIFDVTGLQTSERSFTDSILKELYVLPDQVGDFKVKLHQDYIRSWIKTERVPYEYEEIWNLREQCIANLSA